LHGSRGSGIVAKCASKLRWLEGKLDPGVHFLAKPYRRQELASKLREALDQAD
jgi:hypothetical protein